MKKHNIAKPQAASRFFSFLHLCHLWNLWFLPRLCNLWLLFGLAAAIATAATPATQPAPPYIVLDTMAAPATQPATQPRPSVMATYLTQPNILHLRAMHDLREKLAGLLTPTDELQPSLTWNLKTATALRALSDDTETLLESHIPAATRLAAAQVKVRIDHALLLSAMVEKASVQVSFRLLALRHAAERMRDIPLPAAQTQADGWTLTADLVDLQRNITDPLTRQMRTAECLGRFVESHKPTDETGNPPAVQQVRLMLVMLDDQLGRTVEASRLLPQVQHAAATASPSVQARLRGIARTCQLLGQPIELTARTAGGPWSTAGHRGDVVVIHFFDARHRLPAAKLPGGLPGVWQAMDKAHAQAGGKGLRLLSVAMGGPPKAEVVNAHAWPMVVAPAEAQRLAQRLAVASLPRLVVLDRHGRFVASGCSPAVLAQAKALLRGDQSAATQPKGK